MSSAPAACQCRYCGEEFTAAGIGNHEKYCDENPHPGISPAQQQELGLEESSEAGEPDTGTNPYQEEADSAGTLPPRDTLSASDKSTQSVRADGSTDQVDTDCPLCGDSDTMPSADARREYESDQEEPAAAVVLAFQLSERYCNECFALYGDEFPEPVPLDEAIGAGGDE